MKKIITLFFLLAFINPLVSYGQSQILEEDVHGDHGHEHEEEQSHTGDEGDSHDEHDEHDSHDDHNEEETHDHANEESHEEGVTRIQSDMAEQVGIRTALSGPQSLHQMIQIYGRLTTGPEQTSHVRARFPGMIQSVGVSIGDVVEAGDLLAVVESNDSLKKYDVRAPIDGTIFERHANVGEMTQEQVLFSISNFDSLWVELRVFPSQQKDIRVGQPVFILVNDQSIETIETKISHLLPSGTNANYFVARAKLDGSSTDFFTGLMVEGQVVVNDVEAAVAVENIAIQSMENQPGVFIKNGDEYAFTPLVLGRTDNVFTEVLSGLDSNTEYVTTNSYLIKADIEKSEAEHEH